MTVSLKHAFASAKADGPDVTQVQPSNWNAEHTLTLAAGKILGRTITSDGAAQELAIEVDGAQQSVKLPAGTTALRPVSPGAGMLRYNTDLSRHEVYTSGEWLPVGGCIVAATAPTTTQKGILWFDTTNATLYVYDGSAFQPAIPTLGLSQTWQDMTSSRLHDTVYQNTLSQSIEVALQFRTDAGSLSFDVSADGVTYISLFAMLTGYNSWSAIIPPGYYYRVATSLADFLVYKWFELRP